MFDRIGSCASLNFTQTNKNKKTNQHSVLYDFWAALESHRTPYSFWMRIFSLFDYGNGALVWSVHVFMGNVIAYKMHGKLNCTLHLSTHQSVTKNQILITSPNKCDYYDAGLLFTIDEINHCKNIRFWSRVALIIWFKICLNL